MCVICELKQKIQCLENRIVILEQNQCSVPASPYTWPFVYYGDKTGDTPHYPDLGTWCCARNVHEDIHDK